MDKRLEFKYFDKKECRYKCFIHIFRESGALERVSNELREMKTETVAISTEKDDIVSMAKLILMMFDIDDRQNLLNDNKLLLQENNHLRKKLAACVCGVRTEGELSNVSTKGLIFETQIESGKRIGTRYTLADPEAEFTFQNFEADGYSNESIRISASRSDIVTLAYILLEGFGGR